MIYKATALLTTPSKTHFFIQSCWLHSWELLHSWIWPLVFSMICLCRSIGMAWSIIFSSGSMSRSLCRSQIFALGVMHGAALTQHTARSILCDLKLQQDCRLWSHCLCLHTVKLFQRGCWLQLATMYCRHRVALIYRRKFRSQTSDNMDRWEAEQGRGREKRKIRRKKSRRETVRRKKMQMREKVGKSRKTVFFQWFVAPEGRKVGSLKRRVRSQLAKWEMKNCTPLWREAHFEVKMYKTHQLRTTFTSWDVEKVHAVVARSTFRSQNVQNTRGSDHFWKFRCRKSARRCGAKHISKSKCTKH